MSSGIPQVWSGMSQWDTPHQGILFSASGNYGSRVHDPAPGSDRHELVILLCDACAVAQAVRGNVLRTHPVNYVPPLPELEKWDISELIGDWHAGAADALKLHEFLGMSQEEFDAWARGRGQ